MKRNLFALKSWMSGVALLSMLGLGLASAAQASDGGSLTLAPTQAQLRVGEQLRVLATAKDPAGSVVVQPDVKYGVEPSALGTVDATGLFTAHRVGTGKVVATFSGHRATTDVNVTLHAEAMDVELWPVERDIVSDEYEITSDETVRLEVVATDRFGNEWDATSEAIYSTNDPDGSFIQSTFTPGKLGNFELKATLGELSDINLVSVSAGALYRISIAVPSSVSADDRVKLAATGYDADNHAWDVTDEATFATTDPKGAIRGLTYHPGSAGTWSVTAEVDGIGGSSELRVKSGKIQTISLLPKDQEIRPRGSIHYKVFALDADQNAWDVTPSATFESDAGHFYKNRLDLLDASGTFDVAAQYQDFLETTTVVVSSTSTETNVKVERETAASALDAFAAVEPVVLESTVETVETADAESVQPELTSGIVEGESVSDEEGEVLGVEDENAETETPDAIDETEESAPSLDAPVTTNNTNAPVLAANANLSVAAKSTSGSSTGAWITIGIILALGLIGVGVIGLTQRKA